MSGSSDWTPDEEEALKALIRTTISAMGPIDAASLPSRIKERLEGRVSGDLDLDACIRDVMREMKNKG